MDNTLIWIIFKTRISLENKFMWYFYRSIKSVLEEPRGKEQSLRKKDFLEGSCRISEIWNHISEILYILIFKKNLLPNSKVTNTRFVQIIQKFIWSFEETNLEFSQRVRNYYKLFLFMKKSRPGNYIPWYTLWKSTADITNLYDAKC